MRFNERSFVVLVAVVLVAGAVVAAMLLLGGDDAGDDEAEDGTSANLDGNAAAAFEEGPDEIVMLSGTSIVRQMIKSPEQEILKNVKTQSVYAAPGSSWVAYVKSKAGEDFAGQPELLLYDVETEEKTKLGPGVAPVWNRTGTHVAFIEPVEPRNCIAEECSGDVRIRIADVATGEGETYLDPGTYSILGWAGAHVLVSDFARPDRIISLSVDGETAELDFPATQYWDASPDGRWLIKTNDKKTEFVEFSDGRLGTERVAIELGKLQLLEGTWSHDSEAVAAVVAAGPGVADSSVVTFSPDDPEPRMVAESVGAVGDILWSADNEKLVFGKLVDKKSSLIQAASCPVGNPGDCKSVISWTEGIILLRTE